MTTRPLTDESGFTCDWGGCNNVAVVERLDKDHGWLSVCERHRGPKPRGPATMRGMCPACGKDYALSVAGLLPLHSKGWAACAGSRNAPLAEEAADE